MDGITGKADIYEDVPVELKTTGSLPIDLTFRASYIDQLGMYCAMARRPEGQLLLYRRAASGRSPLLRAYRVTFSDLDLIAAEMRRRRDLLVLTLPAIALANTIFGFVDAGVDLSGPAEERVEWLRQRWLCQDT
jgi:hypothetical protein